MFPLPFDVQHVPPVIALVAGVVILLFPRLLNILVALYLIVVGAIGLGVIR